MNLSPRLSRLIIAGCLALHAALLFTAPGLLPVWGDESFSLAAARQPLPDLLRSYAGDVNPPLHGLLLHFWLKLPWPWEPAVAARLLSSVLLLVATFAALRLWASSEALPVRLWFVALWCLSPTFLLFGRMARSYSLQILLFTLALHAAIRLVEQPNRPRRILLFSLWAALLLYTHYLPALALIAAVLVWSAWPALRLRSRAPLAASLAASGLAALLCSPWLAYLWQTLGRLRRAASPDMPHNPLLAAASPLGYTFFSFTFGETPPDWVFVGAIAATPAVLWLLRIGLRSAPGWLPAVVVAAVGGYLGATRWVGFVFVPARLLFLLPFFLLLLARGIHRAGRPGLAAGGLLLVLWAGSLSSYFQRSGFLNKAYLIPYDEIAKLIRSRSAPEESAVVADACNMDPWPLLRGLEPSRPAVLVGHGSTLEDLRSSLKDLNPSEVWLFRSSNDRCPGRPNQRLAEELSKAFASRRWGYVPYSSRDHWLMRLMAWKELPSHAVELDQVALR